MIGNLVGLMCFRLYIAAQGGTASELELSRTAVKHGLDVRLALRSDTRFIEVAWGDCACSLYTRGEGRERVVAFVRELVAGGFELQLLLFQDGETLDAMAASPVEMAFATFASGGLQALSEALVTRLV